MSLYDPCKSLRVTADTNAALPAQTKVHKIVLINGTLSATASVKLHDAATVTGNPVAEVRSNDDGGATWDEFTQSDFPEPLRFETAVSIDVTGTGVVAYIYYTL